MLRHDWLGSRPGSQSVDLLTLQGPSGQTETLRLEGRVQASQVSALHALCMAGWGIGIAVGISEEDRLALAAGKLLPVLPGWRLADLPVYALTPRRGEQPAKVRHALELLAASFDNPAPAAGSARTAEG